MLPGPILGPSCSHTHQPLTPTPLRKERILHPLCSPSSRLMGIGCPTRPQCCPLSAGTSLPTRGAHTVSPRGCDTGRQRLQSGRCPRSGREPPAVGAALAPGTAPHAAPDMSAGLRQHEELGRGRPRCRRDPRRVPGAGSPPACATCGLCGEGCGPPPPHPTLLAHCSALPAP